MTIIRLATEIKEKVSAKKVVISKDPAMRKYIFAFLMEDNRAVEWHLSYEMWEDATSYDLVSLGVTGIISHFNKDAS